MDEIQWQGASLSKDSAVRLAEPFRIVGYQIMNGNYINSIWKQEDVVHKFDAFLNHHRHGMGQTREIRFLEEEVKVYFFTYSENTSGEFDEVTINFYDKSLVLLGTYLANNAM